MTDERKADLLKLVAKWREKSKSLREAGLNIAGQRGAAQRKCYELAGASEAMDFCADELEAEVERLAGEAPTPPPLESWVWADAADLRSSWGFLMMRLAVASDAQDAYDVAKREWERHHEAFARLERVLPSPGSPEYYKAREALSRRSSVQQE